MIVEIIGIIYYGMYVVDEKLLEIYKCFLFYGSYFEILWFLILANVV